MQLLIGKKSISLTAIGVSLILMALIVLEVINRGSYLDEVLGVLSLLYVLYYAITNYKHLSKTDILFIVALFLSIAWGVISNLTSGISRTWFSIGVDAVVETKVLACFFWMKTIVTPKVRDDIVRIWTPIAKLFLVVAVVCGVLTLFFDTGMYNGMRFGIRSYTFIYHHAHQFTMAAISSLLLILVHDEKKMNTLVNLWIAITMTMLVLTTKGPALVFVAVGIFLMLYFKKHRKLSGIAVAVVCVLILAMGIYQIQNYLLEPNTPRNVFTVYSLKTANRYFPFGSGFATFGSDQASRDYSPLYYEYGFNTMWGMGTKNGWFLSDNFWQGSLAQFGWLGLCIYIVPYMLVFAYISRSDYLRKTKSLLLAHVIQLYVHGFGSATLSSLTGVLGFLVLGMIVGGGRTTKSSKEGMLHGEVEEKLS